MKKNTETAKIPMINQVLKDAALGHLAECGLPQSLISGVDCSSYERMEETLLEVKNCFYSSVRKNIDTLTAHPAGSILRMTSISI